MVEIRIEGPGKNALGTALMADLLAQLDAAGSAPVLLTGAGDAFSAGLDLKEVHGADLAGMERFLTRLTELMARLYHHPAPTVAAVNGHAIAGGYLLALVCDVRISTSNPRARIGLNEVALGLRFPPRLLALARSRLSPVHEHTILLGAALHDPVSALQLGLIDRITDDPLEEARKALAKRASYPPDGYAAAKKALQAGVDAVDEDAQRRFKEEVLPVWSSQSVKDKIATILKL